MAFTVKLIELDVAEIYHKVTLVNSSAFEASLAAQNSDDKLYYTKMQEVKNLLGEISKDLSNLDQKIARQKEVIESSQDS